MTAQNTRVHMREVRNVSIRSDGNRDKCETTDECDTKSEGACRHAQYVTIGGLSTN